MQPIAAKSGDGRSAASLESRGRGWGRLVVVSALVVVVLAACAAGTIWSYEGALTHSNVAVRAEGQVHLVDAASTSFWREREAMNEYLLGPSPQLSAEVASARGSFETALRALKTGGTSDEAFVRLSAQANSTFVRTFLRNRDSARASRRSELHLVAGLNEAEQAVLGPLQALQAGYQDQVRQRQLAARSADVRALVTAFLGGSVGILATLLFASYSVRLLAQVSRRGQADNRASEAWREFAEALQHAETEAEADDLLKRQLERCVPASSAVVLRRNNSDNRLEPSTAASSELATRFADAEPRTCLAVRTGGVQRQGERLDALAKCSLCGIDGGLATCQPILVAGEVIGSALISHAQPLTPTAPDEIARAVSQAGPILANLRNLALAEFRAATDALTGLPNNRAVQDTLKRMAAQASRQLTPLTAIMLDLDHFKQINDQYGHGLGDEALAAVGSVINATLRASDFAGRYGGEEFVMLLPNTGCDEGLVVAEKVRVAVESLRIAGVDRTITASMGVAEIPHDANDSTTLIRHADRLLYVAKSNGRNRVEASTAPSRVEVTGA